VQGKGHLLGGSKNKSPRKVKGIIFILERNLISTQDFFHEGGFKKQMWEEMWGGGNS